MRMKIGRVRYQRRALEREARVGRGRRGSRMSRSGRSTGLATGRALRGVVVRGRREVLGVCEKKDVDLLERSRRASIVALLDAGGARVTTESFVAMEMPEELRR